MPNQIHSLIDKLVADLRSLVRWLILAIVSPTGFAIANWWRSRRQAKIDGITPERKTVLERRKEIREERRKKRTR